MPNWGKILQAGTAPVWSFTWSVGVMEYWEKDAEIGGFRLLQKHVESSRGIVSPLSGGQSKPRPFCQGSLFQRRRFDG
jgi:hypothetical protein